MNVTTRQLQAFLEIARLQSLTRAAERVHISQAGLSMMLQELEQQLGARLFDRTTRSVVPTEAGRRLLPVATRVVEELAGVGAALSADHAKAAGTLRIAATPLVSSSLLPAAYARFRAAFPAVELTLVDAEIGEVRRRVIEGEADLGLGFFFKPAAGMSRTALYAFRLMRVSPAAEQASGPAPASPWSSLKSQRLIGLPADNPIQMLIESNLARIGRSHEDRPVFNLMSTLVGMVEAGLGTAVMPSFAWAECLKRRVRMSLLVQPVTPIDLYVSSRRGAQPKPAATAFVEALREEIPRLMPGH